MTDTLVLKDPAAAAAERLAAAANAGGHVVLTGGSTPRVAYERLSRINVDWSDGRLNLTKSEPDGALMFFFLRLFQTL